MVDLIPPRAENHSQSERTGRLSRRQFLQGALGVGLSASGLSLLAGCVGQSTATSSGQQPLETTKIRLIQVPSLCVAAAYLAEELLKAEGFTEIEYIRKPASAAIIETLASGEADMMFGFAANIVVALDTGVPIVVLAGTHSGCFELFANERVQALRDLKGKTVAVSALGSSEHYFLSSMIAYVGMDATKDVNWVTYPPAESQRLLSEGTIDAVLPFPPLAQELRNKKVGHVVLNSSLDQPWSQYFCCMPIANREFARQNPVATKRVLRAMLKAAEVCRREPERVARFLVDRGYAPNYEYALQTMQELHYHAWHDYEPEDTLRFYALRLREANMITSTPDKIISQGTDWRFWRELKPELKVWRDQQPLTQGNFYCWPSAAQPG